MKISKAKIKQIKKKADRYFKKHYISKSNDNIVKFDNVIINFDTYEIYFDYIEDDSHCVIVELYVNAPLTYPQLSASINLSKEIKVVV